MYNLQRFRLVLESTFRQLWNRTPNKTKLQMQQGINPLILKCTRCDKIFGTDVNDCDNCGGPVEEVETTE